MFCAIEIACTVLGLSILITTLARGSFPMGTNKELRGGPAYAVGGLLTGVLPLGLLIACGVAGYMMKQGKEDFDENDKSFLLIDIAAIGLCVIPAGIIAAVGAKPIKRKKKKKRRPNDEYDDYDDRPIRRCSSARRSLLRR